MHFTQLRCAALRWFAKQQWKIIIEFHFNCKKPKCELYSTIFLIMMMMWGDFTNYPVLVNYCLLFGFYYYYYYAYCKCCIFVLSIMHFYTESTLNNVYNYCLLWTLINTRVCIIIILFYIYRVVFILHIFRPLELGLGGRGSFMRIEFTQAAVIDFECFIQSLRPHRPPTPSHQSWRATINSQICYIYIVGKEWLWLFLLISYDYQGCKTKYFNYLWNFLMFTIKLSWFSLHFISTVYRSYDEC